MSALLTLLAFPLSLFGLNLLNDNGSLSNNRKKAIVATLVLLTGLSLWMFTMGPLRGVFAFLGLLTVVGMVVSYRAAR